MNRGVQQNFDWEEWRRLLLLKNSPEIMERVKTEQGTELQIQARLRRDYPEDLVRSALLLAELRRKALVKFRRADELWFDRIGLEQSTSELIAQHKATRFQGVVWDFCSGIGSDAAAIAARGCDVISVDSDPCSCLRARWNSAVLAPAASIHFLSASVEHLRDRSGLLHLDPDRRLAKASRAVRLEDYRPTLESMQTWIREFSGGAIKLSPAANFGGKFNGCEIELISLHGECKEATIWFGTLSGEKQWRATSLPSGETIAGDAMESVVDITTLGSYLYDPDPAIVRAGLVDVLAEQHGLTRLDPAEEYLTGDSLIDTSFVRPFLVETHIPFDTKDLKAHLRTSHLGQVEIKCRHIPVDVERLRKQLPLQGDAAGVVIAARIDGKARYVICRRTGPVSPLP